MIVVGLTGSLASGKTQAARIFRKLGASVYDADRTARRLLRKGSPAHRAAVKLFGRPYLTRGGEIDRAKLARRVFSRPSDLKKLNTLLHPMVIVDCLQAIEKLRRRSRGLPAGRRVLVLDVPLLFESKMERLADAVVVVRSKPSAMLARAAARGIAPGLAKKILASQWPIEKKAKRADFVIDNDGTVKDLERKVREIYETLSIHTGGK